MQQGRPRRRRQSARQPRHTHSATGPPTTSLLRRGTETLRDYGVHSPGNDPAPLRGASVPVQKRPRSCTTVAAGDGVGRRGGRPTRVRDGQRHPCVLLQLTCHSLLGLGYSREGKGRNGGALMRSIPHLQAPPRCHTRRRWVCSSSGGNYICVCVCMYVCMYGAKVGKCVHRLENQTSPNN